MARRAQGSTSGMSHQSMRVNLASVIFPFTFDLWGRSIIQPQFDENYERLLVSSADIGKDKGVAMACYIHNVMPTTEGYQSIGYTTNIPGDGVSGDFDRCFPLLQTLPNDAHFLFSPSNGKNKIYDATVPGGWQSVSPLPIGTVSDNTITTTAYVQGQTYIYYANVGCFVYDQVNKVLTLTPLGGLVATAVLGLTASFGYMIAFNESTVAWSNATNPVDFVPSLSTGAGGGNVNDIKGNIICCVPVTGGFLVFCEKNVVSAKYTGNIRFPFIFKEIAGSGGISSPDQIAIGSNVDQTYAWTSSGLQVFTLLTCENVFPDCSDYLAKLIYEDFDDTNLVLVETKLANPLNVKITVVADRFLAISYGVSYPEFTYCVLYDMTLKRWGKLKITHRACFQWDAPNLFGEITYGQLINLTYGNLSGITYGELSTSVNTPELPLKTIAFLQGDGTVQTVVFDLQQNNSNGTIILGKFQFERNKWLTLQWVDVENVQADANFAMYALPTLDGKTLQPAIPMKLIRKSRVSRRYAKRVSGQNVSILGQGAFNMTADVIDFTLGGDR